ncbi:lamin tail domain-containing protein [bacterium]|nr:lamin tail domain-containing protein [bacterium]
MSPIIFLLLLMARSVSAGPVVLISQVVDGNLPGGHPKGLELTNVGNAPADLSLYKIGKQANGGGLLITSWLAGMLEAGESHTVACPQVEGTAQWESLFGPGQTADFFPPSVAQINGNDALFLMDAASNVLDAYGVLDVDGVGLAWEYTDSYAVRRSSIRQPRPDWTASEWTIKPVGYLAGFDLEGHIEELGAGAMGASRLGWHEFAGQADRDFDLSDAHVSFGAVDADGQGVTTRALTLTAGRALQISLVSRIGDADVFSLSNEMPLTADPTHPLELALSFSPLTQADQDYAAVFVFETDGWPGEFRVLVTASTPGPQDLLFYEPFDYEAGALSAVSADWTVYSGTIQDPQVSITDSDRYSSLYEANLFPPSGGRLLLDETGDRDLRRDFETESSRVYCSFLLKVLQVPSGGNSFYPLFFKYGSNGFRARLYVERGVAPSTFNLYMDNREIIFNPVSDPEKVRGLSLGSSHFVALRYDKVSGEAAMWFDPESLGVENPPVPFDTDSADPDYLAVPVDQLGLRQDDNMGALELDEIRLGLTWASVTPTSPAPVLNASVSALASFGQVQIGTSSPALLYRVYSRFLQEDAIVRAPDHFEVSLRPDSGFAAEIALPPPPPDGLSTMVWVRCHPSVTGSLSGEILHVSAEAPLPRVGVQAMATSDLPPAITVSELRIDSPPLPPGIASICGSYTLSGSNLTGLLSVEVTGPFDVSTDGSVFSRNLEMAPVSGVVGPVVVSVRFSAPGCGEYVGTIQHTSSDATPRLIELSGRAGLSGTALWSIYE